MPCPIHNNDDDDSSDRQKEADNSGFRAENSQIERREFLKSALVIGGTTALSTVTSLYGVPEIAAADDDHEPIGIAARSNRQHAWDAFEISARGTSVPPPHHLVLLMDYQKDDVSPGHRREVEQALQEIERHFEWSHEGVLFTIGYSPQYFDRYYDESLPAGLDPDDGAALMRAETTIQQTALDREDITADEHDAVLHMASDHVSKLLAVEAALWGEKVDLKGNDVEIEFDSTFEDIFNKPEEYPDRRVGFAGHETVEENLEEDTDFDADQIPEESDLSMGFNPLYENSVPRETNATLVEHQKLFEEKPPGVFAQGSIEHVSKLDIDLDGWYGQDSEERRYQMFSPHHEKEHFKEGNTASVDGDSSAAGDVAMRNADYDDKKDIAERTQTDAEDEKAIGHAQKTARARFDLENRLTEEGKEAHEMANEEREDDLPGHDDEQDLETVMLRRDIDTTDNSTPGVHFIGLMRFNGYMSYMRQAMNGVEFDTASFGLTGEDRIQHDSVDIDQQDSGIVGFLTTQHRGNFLVPPITVRALPYPRAAETNISVTEKDDDGIYKVEIKGGGLPIDTDTVRFGWYLDVNRGGGARPSNVSEKKGKYVFEFHANETGLGDQKTKARLFAKHEDTRKPIRGTVDIADKGEGGDDGKGEDDKGKENSD